MTSPGGDCVQVQKLAPDICPLLVFVNPKSGGLKGRDLLYSFRKLLNPHQVFDISNGGPLAGWVGRPITTRGWSLAGALASYPSSPRPLPSPASFSSPSLFVHEHCASCF